MYSWNEMYRFKNSIYCWLGDINCTHILNHGIISPHARAQKKPPLEIGLYFLNENNPTGLLANDSNIISPKNDSHRGKQTCIFHSSFPLSAYCSPSTSMKIYYIRLLYFLAELACLGLCVLERKGEFACQ